jgi:hypothetical protein
MSTAGARDAAVGRSRRRRARRLGGAGLVLGLALLLVGTAAGPAAAHTLGTGPEASNYRTTVRGIDQGTPGLSVRAVAGEQLELTNRSDQEVLVLGYRLEPYLRVGPGGVFENRRSPSAYTNRFRTAPATIPSEFDPEAAPEWRRIGDGPSATWHEHRAHWTGPDPPAVTASPRAMHVVISGWQVPLRQGDRTMVVWGDVTWIPGPSPWPWVLAAVALFAAALAAAGGYRRPRVLAAVALLAVAADMVHTAGALLVSTAPLAAQLYGTVTSAAGWVVAGFAAYRLLRGRTDTGLLYLLLGGVFLTLAGALPDLPALGRSQVTSGFGPVVTRAAIVFTLGLGGAMVAAGLAGFRSPRRSRPASVS